jgi:hypothetical protein
MQAERKRVPIAGRVRACRPKPADFRETYIAIGWQGTGAHYRTNWRVIRRWIEEEGREGLIAARAAAVERQRRKARFRKYVIASGGAR